MTRARMTLLALALMLATAADWRDDVPGARHQITVAAMPAPYATTSAGRPPAVVARPGGAALHVPPGFSVAEYASGLDQPRTLRTAPNGDVFLAESGSGRIRIFRAPDGAARPATTATFADGLTLPFGIAFWPPGPSPTFVYVAETNRVIRFPYVAGDLKARGAAQVVMRHLPEGGHWTRDLAVSPDGETVFLSVGSSANIATELTGFPPPNQPLGAAWGDEQARADVLALSPDGKDARIFATGLRNCSAEAIQPGSGDLWCAVNERDGLGDDLPPDYVTVVQQGAFYGWPWYYIGSHEDPRLAGTRTDLAGSVTTPDILIQPHSAPLGITFYDGTQFPAAYRGDAFVALHGSWNRGQRTGYKVIRLRFDKGVPTGAYEDFLTGFVVSDEAVWGRPVGVTVAHDGSLLVSEDGNGTVWRIAYQGGTR
ncbi:MAG: PQQ-dependent sugar dehydrogenase [Acetobacteraceae bacterium]|nr:PQQ-dependent sugar dehydrogenase [Acetobacteraceae bacterium]